MKEKFLHPGAAKAKIRQFGTEHCALRFRGFVNGVGPLKKFILLVASVLVMSAATVPAFAQQRVKVGTLSCDISGGIGMIIASQKTMACNFLPSRGGREGYVGSITKFGLDVGATGGGRMVWAVYAPTSRSRAALAGAYAGASAEATVGAGVGANVLFGGNERTVSLQPVSLQGQAGLNLAVGVSGLELQPARAARVVR